MPTLFRKWWVILIQGILLIILGFYFLNRPFQVLAAISFWVSLLTIVVGAAGLFGHFSMPKEERESAIFWWSLITLLFGILMISKLGITMKTITVFFGIWMMITGYWLFKEGWAQRSEGGMAWLMVVIGLLSVISGIIIIFNLAAGALWISTILGLQTLIAGIGMVFLALGKRKLVHNVKSRLQHG